MVIRPKGYYIYITSAHAPLPTFPRVEFHASSNSHKGNSNMKLLSLVLGVTATTLAFKLPKETKRTSSASLPADSVLASPNPLFNRAAQSCITHHRKFSTT